MQRAYCARESLKYGVFGYLRRQIGFVRPLAHSVLRKWTKTKNGVSKEIVSDTALVVTMPMNK
jgi:hypothetical protein